MKRKLYISFLVAALAMTLFGPILALAEDAGSCHAIRNSDARAACLAKAHSDTGRCYNIMDGDRRMYCLANEHRDTGRCYSIMYSDLRAQCLAEVRR